MTAFNTPSLKGRALRYLSMREHSRFELVQKLTPFEEVPGELAQALDDLEFKGFISDQRTAESVVRRRGSRLGAGRVLHELRAKGLDAQTVQAATVELKATELERAQEVWRRKFGEPPADAAARMKQMRFLAGRGFAGEVVGRVVPRVGVRKDFSADAPDA
jgi:regulatory protein